MSQVKEMIDRILKQSSWQLHEIDETKGGNIENQIQISHVFKKMMTLLLNFFLLFLIILAPETMKKQLIKNCVNH